jgi:ubiquinone biosynthesis protein COQ9
MTDARTHAGDSGPAPSDLDRERLLDLVLELVPEWGWNDAALAVAADRLKLSSGQVKLAVPGGAADLAEAYARRVANRAEARMREPDISAMKIRDKVKAGVKAWLAAMTPHKAALKRASGSPHAMLAGPGGLWTAADAIWAGLGDTSHDFNWYTKRATLSAVLGSTLLAWLGTDNDAEVDEFLSRRIENVMQFEKAKKDVQAFFESVPNPFDMMGGKPPPQG